MKISKIYFIVSESASTRRDAARRISQRYQKGLSKIWERFGPESRSSILNEDHDVDIISDPELCTESFKNTVLSFLKSLTNAPETEWVEPDRETPALLEKEQPLEPDAVIDGVQLFAIRRFEDFAQVMTQLSGSPDAPDEWLIGMFDEKSRYEKLLTKRFEATGVYTRHFIAKDEEGRLRLLGVRGSLVYWADALEKYEYLEVPIESLPEFVPEAISRVQVRKQMLDITAKENIQGFRDFVTKFGPNTTIQMIEDRITDLFQSRLSFLRALYREFPEIIKPVLDPGLLLKNVPDLPSLEFLIKDVGVSEAQILSSVDFERFIYNLLTAHKNTVVPVLKVLKEALSPARYQNTVLRHLVLQILSRHEENFSTIADFVSGELAGNPMVLRILSEKDPLHPYFHLLNFIPVYKAFVDGHFSIEEIDEAFDGSILSFLVSKSHDSMKARRTPGLYSVLITFIQEVLLDKKPSMYDLNLDGYDWVFQLTIDLYVVSPEVEGQNLLLLLIKKLKTDGIYDFSHHQTSYTAFLRIRGISKADRGEKIYNFLIRDERIRTGNFLTQDDELDEQRIMEARKPKVNLDEPVLSKTVNGNEIWKIGNQKALTVLARTVPTLKSWNVYGDYDKNRFGSCYYALNTKNETGATRDFIVVVKSTGVARWGVMRRNGQATGSLGLAIDVLAFLNEYGLSSEDFPYFIPGEDPEIEALRKRQNRVLAAIVDGVDTETLKKLLRGISWSNWDLSSNPLERAIMYIAGEDQINLLIDKGFGDTSHGSGPDTPLISYIEDIRIFNLLKDTLLMKTHIQRLQAQATTSQWNRVIMNIRAKHMRSLDTELLYAQLMMILHAGSDSVRVSRADLFQMVLSALCNRSAKKTREVVYKAFLDSIDAYLMRVIVSLTMHPGLIMYLEEHRPSLMDPLVIFEKLWEFWMETNSLAADKEWLKQLRWWFSKFPDKINADVLYRRIFKKLGAIRQPVKGEIWSFMTELMKEHPEWFTNKFMREGRFESIIKRIQSPIFSASDDVDEIQKFVRATRVRTGTFLTHDDELDENRRSGK